MKPATNSSNTEPMVPVLADKFATGWPANDATKVCRAPLSLALGRRYKTDVHVAQYSSPEPYRLNGDAVGKTPIEMVAVLFDIDGPGHKCEPAWWASVRGKVFDMLDTDPEDGPTQPVLYQTRGGARLLAKLPRPIRIEDESDAKAWTALTAAWRRYLNRRYELRADDACKSWNWLFRAPHATRDGGGDPENLEVIGDFMNIGTWSNVELTADDMAHEPEPVHARSERFTGYGVVYNLLSDRGWLGKELEPGMWSARCPWSHSHTSGKDYDTSTVVFAPGPGQALGSLHCKHEHCVDRGHDDLLREFTNTQLQNAGYVMQRATAATDKKHSDGAKAEKTATGYPILKLCDIPDEGPPTFLIDKLWTEQSVGIIGGDPKALKSFNTLYMAIHIAAGRPLYGKYPVKQGRVLIFNAEDKASRTRYRAEGICRALGIKLKDVDVSIVGVDALFMDRAEDVAMLRQTVEKHKPALLVLDPLRNLHGLDENDSRLVPNVLQPIRGIQKAHGCSIMVVHHLVKATDGKRPAARLRGTGALRGWYDSAMIMDRPTPDSPVQVDLEHRDAEDVTPFAFKFQATNTPDGVGFLFELANAEPGKPSIQQQVIAFKAFNPGMSGRKALDAMRASGIVFRNDDFWLFWKAA